VQIHISFIKLVENQNFYVFFLLIFKLQKIERERQLNIP
jgi:hypothetical protein